MAPLPLARNQLRLPTISLEGMSVIDLTQQPARPAAISGSNSAARAINGNATNHNGALSGVRRNAMLVPKPDDEPPVDCILSGKSISFSFELCGWSFLQPMKFYNIRETTRFRSMTDERGEVIATAADLKNNKCITLREMEHFSRAYDGDIFDPVFVHVVAKRKVDVASINGQTRVTPLVIIADNSGYCALCSINEGFSTIYNEVEVGDQLLITKCRPQVPHRTYHRGLFSDTMFLCLELKLQYHSVRNHYIWKFSPLRPAQFAMPLQLFDSSCQLKLPGELETEFSQPPNAPPAFKQYYDLIGVVTYVGRIERFQNMDPQNVECLVNDEIQLKKITRFFTYRWIYLIDRNSQPFPVKVYVDNTTRPHQAALVPGAILVLSHCQTVNCTYSGKITRTSHFSQMYLEENIEKYVMLHPPSFRDKASELLKRQNYTQIMNRPEIQLAVGGTHAQKIVHPDKFRTFYRSRVRKDIPAEKPLLRRESSRRYFEGIILRVQHYLSEDMGILFYVHPSHPAKRRTDYSVVENFLPFPRYSNTSWYYFQRKLPPCDPSVFRKDRCRDIVEKIVALYKPLLGPLLMPAEMPLDGSTPPMAALEKVDGAPYLLIDIVNEETRIWYTVIWKSCHVSIEEKLEKVKAAIDKKIICLAEVFCTELDAMLEVNLLDFVTSNY